ncbi:GNAT family N-acetyltransferase [Clostridium beijerinckii]|uniref:GNAT family N-acetyltransferase n=1 Tax=Clostridium beijerinckii TaxID=1520 RepID=UPI00156F7D8B|nr:GNAT family N-acetyltransferase [Clostridium beijerinckii]NRT71945.1 ribosomal protein S18 acetylase RimI-like enzyme [Clostridium beijerinckii]
MNLRLAKLNDLPKLKAMYGNIIDDMDRNNIPIWDEIYPREFLNKDIENNRLYLLIEKDDNIVGSFALCESNAEESCVKWENSNDKALYIERFAVNVDYSRQGIGSIMLKHAITLTRNMNVKYLRLLVVNINKPAINLYLKKGFRQVDGIYEEIIDANLTFHEYGFEIDVLR